MIVIYYIGLFLCGGVQTFAQQRYGRKLQRRTDIWIYALVTGIMSMLFFGISSGFSIVLNPKTVFYSLILTTTALISYFIELLVYRYMGIAEIAVITAGGKLLLTPIAGWLLFSEKVSLISVTRIALMLVAVLLIFLQKKKSGRADAVGKAEKIQAVTSIGLLFCILIICVGTISTIISKYIAIDTKVTNTSSLYFFTNALIMLFSALFLLIESRGHFGKCVSELRDVPGKQYLTIIMKTAAGSASSLLSVLILATGAVSLYVPLTNALGLLTTEIVAVLILRERPLILPMIPAILSMLLAFFG